MKFGLALAGTTLLASAAVADTVDVRFLGIGRGTNTIISLGGDGLHVFTGQLWHEFSNGTGEGAELDGNYITYCSDLTQYVTRTTKTYKVEALENLPDSPGAMPMGPAAAQAIFDIHHAAAGAQVAPNASKAFATAFQLAIWEIVYDFDGSQSSLDVDSGDFRVHDLASTYEGAIDAGLTTLFAAVGHGASGEGIYGVSSGYAQDQIVLVPLPMPAMLGAVGLGGAFLLRRRIL